MIRYELLDMTRQGAALLATVRAHEVDADGLDLGAWDRSLTVTCAQAHAHGRTCVLPLARVAVARARASEGTFVAPDRIKVAPDQRELAVEDEPVAPADDAAPLDALDPPARVRAATVIVASSVAPAALKTRARAVIDEWVTRVQARLG